MLEHTKVSLSCFGGGHDRAAAFGDERHAILVVADGAGGASAASRAAELVVDVVREVHARRERPLGVVGVRALLERIDRMMLASRHTAESTAVIVEVVDDCFWGASCGDSGAWLVHGRHHLDLTARQQRKWRLGSGLAAPVGFGPLPLVGTLLLATDGLLECAPPEHVEDAVGERPLDDVAGALVSGARAPDGALRDDLALVLCRRVERAVYAATG